MPGSPFSGDGRVGMRPCLACAEVEHVTRHFETMFHEQRENRPMSRIPYPDLSVLPDEMQRMLAGTPLNIVRMGAHASQPMFEAQGRLAYAIARADVLDPRVRETAILRVAHLSGSAYELHHHLALARLAGLGETELAAIAGGTYGALDPLLAAVAAFVDEVVRDISPSDAALERLRALVSDEVLVNIVLTVGNYMTIARLIAVAGPEIDDLPLAQLPTGH
jgi:alkylhydroperoxidase family enzyme